MFRLRRLTFLVLGLAAGCAAAPRGNVAATLVGDACKETPPVVWRIDGEKHVARLANVPFGVALPVDTVVTTERPELLRVSSPANGGTFFLFTVPRCQGYAPAELKRHLAKHETSGSAAPLVDVLGTSESHEIVLGAVCSSDGPARVTCEKTYLQLKQSVDTRHDVVLEQPSERLIKTLPAIDGEACGAATEYPSWSMGAGTKASVTLRIGIDAKGATIDVKVVKSFRPAFDDVAVSAMRHQAACRFKPAIATDGTPVPFVIRNYVFRFE